MFDKIKWKQEWRIFQKTERDRYGAIYCDGMVIMLTDGAEKFEVILSKNKCIFEADANFYGFPNRSALIRAHVIPGELLEFEVCSCMIDEINTTVTIRHLSSEQYAVNVYSPRYIDLRVCSPEQDINEILNKEELNKKLSHIVATFDEFPLLVLPLGNSFSIN